MRARFYTNSVIQLQNRLEEDSVENSNFDGFKKLFAFGKQKNIRLVGGYVHRQTIQQSGSFSGWRLTFVLGRMN